jgi:Leucine-rich repeat (LRR) protein
MKSRQVRMRLTVIVSSLLLVSLGIVGAESFDSLEKAVAAPERATTLSLNDPHVKHLPAKLGTLTNLTELDISCLEELEDLPIEIGQLKKLEKLIIDNGNGCQMNVSIPASIGELTNLKVLNLNGAMDPTPSDTNSPIPASKIKTLPATIAKLQNIEELDLERDRLQSVPLPVASLKKLKKLDLDYNDVHELPSFVGELGNLQELSVRSNGGIKLPDSLSKLSGLKISMGNNYLKLRDQLELRRRFPNATFDFENEYDDDAANEESH